MPQDPPVPSASASGLRTLLRLAGAVATAAGLHTAMAGAGSVPGRRRMAPVDAALDGELRFYGTFYGAYGVALWQLAPAAERETGRVRALASILFAAGVARALGWRAAGRPTSHQIGLLVIELAAPPLVVAWQARVAASS